MSIAIIIIATPDFLSLYLQSANHTVDNYTLWNGLPSYIVSLAYALSQDIRSLLCLLSLLTLAMYSLLDYILCVYILAYLTI